MADDVYRALGINNSADILRKRPDNDEKGVSSIDTLGGVQYYAVLTEYGLYSLILGSRKKEGKEFKRWGTHEVILRK